jgi:RNA polymerase sigma-70 factor (ECF subfamily)
MRPDHAAQETHAPEPDLAFCDAGQSAELDPDDPGLEDLDDGAMPEVAAACQRLAPDVNDVQLNQWINAIVDHDEKAMAALYDATMTRVFGIVLRIVRKRALAEEVVEDTFFQVWRQAARFDASRGRAITWLLGMARSRAIDCLRREARFQHENLDDHTAPDLPDHGPAADELLDTARHHADLHRALTLLNTQPRQLVAMAFLQGLSHEEIATQTLLPLGTVKSQIRRALLTLRQLLGDHTLSAMRNALP